MTDGPSIKANMIIESKKLSVFKFAMVLIQTPIHGFMIYLLLKLPSINTVDENVMDLIIWRSLQLVVLTLFLTNEIRNEMIIYGPSNAVQSAAYDPLIANWIP